MKQFEDLKIKQLKRLYDQHKRLNPEFKTAAELLKEMEEGK